MIYDLDRPEVLPRGQNVPPEENCCFTFSEPDRKQEALLGIIHIPRQ